MKLSHLAAAAALLAATTASYAGTSCTSTFSLGTMGPPATKSLGNSFGSGNSFDWGTAFNDCYDFSINAPASASGSTTETSASFWFLPRYVDVLAVSLFNSITGSQVSTYDLTPDSYAFSNLAASSYRLIVTGYASLGFGTASYSGSLTTAPTTVASPVPEAPLSAMLAMAMIGAALVTRRATKRD